MKAGRELDALIATKVMGLKDENGFYVALDCPPYSTDISAAWQVVEKMDSDGWNINLTQTIRGVGGWCADFYSRDGKRQRDEIEKTAPHAICLAALAALGVKIE